MYRIDAVSNIVIISQQFSLFNIGKSIRFVVFLVIFAHDQFDQLFSELLTVLPQRGVRSDFYETTVIICFSHILIFKSVTLLLRTPIRSCSPRRTQLRAVLQQPVRQIEHVWSEEIAIGGHVQLLPYTSTVVLRVGLPVDQRHDTGRSG